MALVVREVYYAVESPGDGAGGVAATWRSGPGPQGHRAPAVHGGIHRAESREQFRRYTAAAADSPLRDWARRIADLPD
jgi:tRNA(adenine34) deaminase